MGVFGGAPLFIPVSPLALPAALLQVKVCLLQPLSLFCSRLKFPLLQLCLSQSQTSSFSPKTPGLESSDAALRLYCPLESATFSRLTHCTSYFCLP